MNKSLLALSLVLIGAHTHCDEMRIALHNAVDHTNRIEYPSYYKQFEIIKNLPKNTPSQEQARLVALRSLQIQVKKRIDILSSDLNSTQNINLHCMTGSLKHPICTDICDFIDNACDARDNDHALLEEITEMLTQEAIQAATKVQPSDNNATPAANGGSEPSHDTTASTDK